MGTAGEFCWVDLAATNSAAAQVFYQRLFGWKPLDEAVGDGRFTRLQLNGRDVGSMYQLRSAHLLEGVPSHWTPYVRVDDIEHVARQAAAYGGKVLIAPFTVGSIARIALIMDRVGALIGLWESIAENENGGAQAW